MSLLRWTTKSLEHLIKALAAKGHRIGKTALVELLHTQGLSRRANNKSIEGRAHADSNA